MPPPTMDNATGTMEPPKRSTLDTIESGVSLDATLSTLHEIKDLVEAEIAKIDEQDFSELLKGSSVLMKVKLIVELAVPVIGSYSLYQMTSFVILYYAGHLSSQSDDATVFAGISMANMFANVTCFSILIGMTSAVETLASQNNGAKNYREVGLVLQRSIFILSVLLIPIAIIWLYAEDIFLLLGTDPAICVVMGKYLKVRMATMPVDVVAKSYEKYLCCLGITKPPLYAYIVAIISMLIFGELFVRQFQWGYESLAAAFVISTYLSFFCMFMCSYFHPAVQRTLQPFSMDAFDSIKEFLVLGFPGLAMLCSEWWAYELLTMFASQLGAEAVASQTVIIQMASLAYMVPLGIGIAATTLVGNTVGSGDIDLAKEVSKLSLYCCFFCEIGVSALIFFCGEAFIHIFTDDRLVIEISRRTIPILALMTWVDGISAVLGGITRGAGKQHLGAYANIPAFYLVALPLAWFLCFKTSLGVIGLVLGIAIGPILVDICLGYLIFIKKDFVFTQSVYAPLCTESIDVDQVNGVETGGQIELNSSNMSVITD